MGAGSVKPARADITHRDITPANVSITWTSEIDDARLLRVREILESILANPVDSEGTPGDGPKS